MAISNYQEKNYICQWCNRRFSKDVIYFTGDGKKSNGSNQVRCPNCNGLIPTWKKEETGNIIGKKHIHIR